MKTTTYFLSLILISSLFYSCDLDHVLVSKRITTREVSYSDYSGLKVSNAFNVYVTFSETEEKIEIEANENLQDKISVQKEGNDLVIKMKRHTVVRGKSTLDVYIKTKKISNFDISGASEITLENELVAQDVHLELSGASEFYGALNVEQLQLRASGASNLDLFGNADQLDASLAGSSELKDYDLIVKALDLRLSGASEAFVSVTETIDISASGASTLYYKGDAIIRDESLSGSSNVKKRD
ncbi:head GIN domain-containing protein [Kriegella aquimaris]|uniref:Putative auto-transporter adhesin, head GIN domain n=1 Tax=Kriegella aquimaris TaxID=192904 RepID=A0A1G9IWU7_9FLAO|nr:head GIN domain-containing protein [Kriegella aquimaris]SDL29535.1 Putative auto-transporter adhesin, head GIN domain [Kriegella aquimaris]